MNTSFLSIASVRWMLLLLVCLLFTAVVFADVTTDSDNIATFIGTNIITDARSYGATLVGDQAGDTNITGNNSLLLTGAAAHLQNDYQLYLGISGNSNTLRILDGASVNNTDTYVGDAGANHNRVHVSGANSMLSNSNRFEIGGEYSSDNRLKISKGGIVSSAETILGYDDSNASNTILVKGAGSKLISTSRLIVGLVGDENKIKVKKGALAQSGAVIISQYSDALKNSIRVTGINSDFISTNLIIGQNGSGKFTLDKNASAEVGSITLAQNHGSKGSLNIGRKHHDDAGGTLTASTITFGAGDGAINFNQNDVFQLNSQIIGGTNAVVRQRGTGTTVFNESNNYAGKTDVDAGTIEAANKHAFGTSHLKLDGGNLDLDKNLSVSSLSWRSDNSVIDLSSPEDHLKVHHLKVADSDTIHYFNVQNLDADSQSYHTLIRYKKGNGAGNYALEGVDPSTYSIKNVANKNGKGGKIEYKFTDDTLNVGTNDEIASSEYKAGNVKFHQGSSLTIDRDSTLNVKDNFVGDGNSRIVYVQNSVLTGPGIEVKGNANLNGEKLDIVFDQPPVLGSIINVMSAGSVTGSFGDVSLSDPSLRARKLCVGDPLLYLLIAPASYTQVAINQNQTNVARALNSFTNATSGDNYTVSFALDSLTVAQYPIAFQQIMPALYSSFSTIAFNNANAQNNALVERLGNIRVAGVGFDSTGLSAAPISDDNKKSTSNGKDILIPSVDNHWGVFTDANGIFANVNINNQLPGYTSESGGITIGADYKWNETFSTGLYTGYEGTQSKQNAGNFICDNGSRFGAFGTYQHGGVFANAIVGGDTHSYQVNRTIQFPGINRTASSAPTAQELDTMLATGYDMKRGDFTFGPITSLQYTYLGVQPFTETGAQSLNLNVESQNANSLIYSLGSHCFYTWQLSKEVLVVPQINLAWQHEFLQNPYAINSTLEGGGGVFNYTTVAPLRDSLYTGIGFTVNLAKKYNASFFYNASAGNTDLVSQNFFASLGVNF